VLKDLPNARTDMIGEVLGAYQRQDAADYERLLDRDPGEREFGIQVTTA